jgi:peptide/nickel transport system ATP-binding protein
MTGPDPVLAVEGLTIGYATRKGNQIDVVRDVGLTVERGGSLGIVGETGCGKSTLALAMLGFLRAGSRVVSGTVRLDGEDLFAASTRRLAEIRSSRLGLVPQNSGQALTPTKRIGAILEETARIHQGLTPADARVRCLELLEAVRLPDPGAIARRYPHQLSGGQQQRVAIALALVGTPDAIVLDEPTTGLDVTTQAQVLALLADIRADTGAALVFISHDLGVIANTCDRTAVMYAGQLVEVAPTDVLYGGARHPYAQGLLASVPRIDAPGLPAALPGFPPAPTAIPTGCPFHPRCYLADAACAETSPALLPVGDPTTAAWHGVRCHHRDATADGSYGDRGSPSSPGRASLYPRQRLLNVSSLTTGYGKGPRRRARWGRAGDGRRGSEPVVAGVDLHLERGETLALVGESGSGKSTIGRVLAGLHPAWEGSIAIEGEEIGPVARRTRDVRRRLQLIFQNPDASLNPRRTAGSAVRRPLELFFPSSAPERGVRVAELLGEVGLSPAHATRFPGQLSGGEKQRVSIARAFAASPELVVCDEIVSALDVSVQAAVLGLLERLQEDHQVSYVFISHDLAVVRAVADRVAVLYRGQLCEVGATDEVYRPPYHPYTKLLLDAVLEPTPGAVRRPRAVDRDIGNEPAAADTGCVFRSRCPMRVSICTTETPPWRTSSAGSAIRCHRSDVDLVAVALEKDGEPVGHRV